MGIYKPAKRTINTKDEREESMFGPSLIIGLMVALIALCVFVVSTGLVPIA